NPLLPELARGGGPLDEVEWWRGLAPTPPPPAAVPLPQASWGRICTLRPAQSLPHSLMMAPRSDAPVRAILGPTNTGKTHLAIERMCGHSSGVIGFPLRLLAREVYDRVVGIKGDKQVALLTGEERIVPPQARYFLCTAESMPVLSGKT